MTTTTLKLAQLFRSKTFWTIAVLVMGNIINVRYGLVSANVSDLGNSILGIIAAYFHVTPGQDYTLTANSFNVPSQTNQTTAGTDTMPPL